MIKLQIIGHLGKDAEVREVNGKKVISFNVAHSERFKDSAGNLQSKTQWVSCSYWTDSTGVLPYLIKGKLVYVEGTPSVDAYMSSAQNQPAASLNLRVLRVELLGGGDSNQDAGNQTKDKEEPVHVQEDDLPF